MAQLSSKSNATTTLLHTFSHYITNPFTWIIPTNYIFALNWGVGVWTHIDTKTQNPGYMKDNFVVCIESLHLGDVGHQKNVSASSLVVVYSFISMCFSFSSGWGERTMHKKPWFNLLSLNWPWERKNYSSESRWRGRKIISTEDVSPPSLTLWTATGFIIFPGSSLSFGYFWCLFYCCNWQTDFTLN